MDQKVLSQIDSCSSGHVFLFMSSTHSLQWSRFLLHIKQWKETWINCIVCQSIKSFSVHFLSGLNHPFDKMYTCNSNQKCIKSVFAIPKQQVRHNIVLQYRDFFLKRYKFASTLKKFPQVRNIFALCLLEK